MSLFYCTVHSIMWTIRNSKALGKKQQQRPRRLFNPSFFFFFFLFISCKVVLAVCFSFCFFFSHLTCLNEEEETFGLLFPGSSSRRWATFGTLCCSSSVLNAQRRKSRPTRRQAVDVPLVLMITVSCACLFVFSSSSVFETKGPFRRAEDRRIVESQSFLFFVCT